MGFLVGGGWRDTITLLSVPSQTQSLLYYRKKVSVALKIKKKKKRLP